ncbi:YbjN domain-containing protein [Parasedimentitalea maritima]|uniref:YbjN domain-containing protein n=1 Tax=Parasedimentitalea maritima TaxID=2578117 RepID=A0A5R8Z7D9_9RHOB|nr:YbjN domain-containing protein [Zongyanglinia marina]KAE9628958.1 YbjN domain-containing protein [Zongyanglinia marina]TLP61454.1 YbjN domain-containing protein [Zongyanglinia marina]
MNFIAKIAAAAVLSLPSMASAQMLVASDPDSLVQFFVEEGADVESTVDNTGDPMLEVDYYGTDFTLYFYGCTNNSDCKSIQFFSGYQTEGSVRKAKINEWNANNRFARGYISEGGSARIEHDLYLGNTGVTADDFAALTSKWSKAQGDFEEFIDW